MPRPSKLEATEFFGQLRRFSRRAVEKTLRNTPPSSPNAGAWRKSPKGAILHYTASGDWKSPVRWFNAFPKASAHVVVAHHLDPALAGLADDLPLVKALPVTTIQCVDPRLAAWHATWVNGLCYGIENRNAGLVKRDNPSAPWRHWPKAPGSDEEWTAPAPVTGQAYVATSDTTGYEPYSKAQLVTDVLLLRYVAALFGEPLEPHWVLPHSAVQSNKFDTGPLFPIHEVRRLACIDIGADPWAAFDDLTAPEVTTSGDDLTLPPPGEDRRVEDATEAFDEYEARLAALASVEADQQARPHPFAAVARPQLDKLGFFVPTPIDPRTVDVWMRRALWIFQTGAKLPATSLPDNPTRSALATRIAELGLAP